MPTFRKFAFPDGDTADKVLGEFLNPLDFAVPLGHFCAASDSEGNCIKTRPEFAVDILFNDSPAPEFQPFIVWPKPCGVHAFAGWEEQYAEDHKEFATQSQK